VALYRKTKMSYVANKKMNLAGMDFTKGEEVPDETFNEMGTARQGAMLRTRLIIEVETIPTPPGDPCPHCDEGPFQRLAQHISTKHKAETEAMVEVSAEQVPEESDGNS